MEGCPGHLIQPFPRLFPRLICSLVLCTADPLYRYRFWPGSIFLPVVPNPNLQAQGLGTSHKEIVLY